MTDSLLIWYTLYIALILDKRRVTLPGEDGTFLNALTGKTNDFVKNIMKIND